MYILIFLLLQIQLCFGDVVFIDNSGKATVALQQLLALDGLYDPQDTLDEIVQKTQKSWKRVHHGANGFELADLVDSPKQLQIREDVLSIARQMGLFDEKKPSSTHYDYALCAGAFLQGVRLRVNELIQAWKQGVRFDQLVFLTGDRALRKAPGEKDFLQDIPEGYPYETEYDMVRLVWEQTQIPEDMEIQVVFINAKCPVNQARISTKDSFNAWLLDYNPTPGSCLSASHPLYWTYQELGFALSGFSVDCIAPSAEGFLKQNDSRIVSLIFDTIAKCLYEIFNIRRAIIEGGGMNMVGPVDHTNHAHGPPAAHQKVAVDKGVEQLNELLTDLQGLTGTVPPAVQELLNLGGQLATLLSTRDLTELHGVIPALHKTIASLNPIVHQLKKELEDTTTVDFEKGPFSTAWTNTLLDKATAQLTSFIQLIT